MRNRYPMCDHQLTVESSAVTSNVAFKPDRRTVYEQEPLLTLDAAPFPVRDLWIADLQEGCIRELNHVFQGFEDSPDLFYIQFFHPFWLIFQRLLQLLPEHAPGSWRCQPVKWLVIAVCFVVLWATSACGIVGTGVKSGSNTLTVINGVEGSICTLRLKKASSQTFWGRNRLSSNQRLAQGESIIVRGLAAGYYDVDAFLCDDDIHPGYLHYDVAVGPDAASTWTIGK